MPKRDIIVIGASAGGVEAGKKLVSLLPGDFAGSIFLVIHLPGNGVSVLPQIMSHWGPLPATHPRDGARIEPGRIYIAPPDYHMLLKPEHIRLVAGPEENHSRPAVDPLFRSAAAAYGSRVVGVVLSGNLDDGTAGLRVIKKRGGIAVVQDPADALFPGMPTSAMANVDIDHSLPVDRIPELLTELVKTDAPSGTNPGEPAEERDILELSIGDLQARVDTGKAIGISCPQCGGVLREKIEGDSAEYRCRVGHAFSSGYLESMLSETVEAALWSAVRVLEEKEQLYHKLSDRMQRVKSASSAAHFRARGKKASEDARIIRQIILASEKKARAGAG